eukprot:GFUD01012059.1.p1 GENE.GFUD01012059.1~~GFUD01012059.1.p1  ORF type:complete len:239 (+),score=25.94 GFUD01012059.1:75-791(+)
MIKIDKLVVLVCLGLTLHFEGTCSQEMCKKPKGFVGDTAQCTKVNQKAEWVRIISPETSIKQENINNNNCFYTTAATTQGFFWNMAMVIKRSNQIALLPYIAKTYSVSFDVLINNLGNSSYNSIIHFTIGADNSVYGDRTPAVWLYGGIGFLICSAINGNKDKCYTDPIQRQVGVWYHVEISQYLTTGNKLRYDIKINQETVFNVENTQAEQFEKVQVFSGDQGSPLDGLISNIAVKT